MTVAVSDDRENPGRVTRVSNVADFSATLHLSEHIRVVDTFRFWDNRIPERFNSVETDRICTDTATCSLLTPLSDTTPQLSSPTSQGHNCVASMY
jgi:hypothetical protein